MLLLAMLGLTLIAAARAKEARRKEAGSDETCPNEGCSASVFGSVGGIPTAPPDVMFRMKELYASDPAEDKVDTTIGAYRTDDGQPYVLPCVREAREALVAGSGGELRHEYLPIDGLPAFTKAAQGLLFDGIRDVVPHVATVQALSGTGALRLGFELLHAFLPTETVVFIPATTWPNHFNVVRDAGYGAHDKANPSAGPVRTYRYLDAGQRLDFDGLKADLAAAPRGAVVLLHLCAHNPSGVDLSPAQWEALAAVFADSGLVAFFDNAYQGFTGNTLEEDAYPLEAFGRAGVPLLCAQSFSKNFGLYGERTGALHVAAASAEEAEAVRSQLKGLIRPMYSNPPSVGARIVATVLGSEDLTASWHASLKEMTGRIMAMRAALRSRLEALTGDDWAHITEQIGMFSYTGLKKEHVVRLRDHSIYMAESGRMSMAGINSHNVEKTAAAIAEVLAEVAGTQ